MARQRQVVAVVGDGSVEPDSLACQAAYEIGKELAMNGYVVMTGGKEGIMEAACRGAKSSKGVTVGVLPGSDPKEANSHVDIPVPTGMGHLRNGIVAHAQAIIVVGGGAGTKSEVCMAWILKRLIISMRQISGCSQEVADHCLDDKVRFPSNPHDKIFGADCATEVINLLEEWLPQYTTSGL